MIAVPRDDGGVTVTGSLQCPYYVHAALKRGLGLDDRQAQVVQAETGGGFGGKEEYPSIIALHAALLARKAERPVRMIYDRHEDIAATTKRHPAIVRHRTGVTADGRLLAQDIEVVMDGGAYCTLTPVVLQPRRAPRRRPVPLPERAHPGAGDAHEHAAQRRVPRVRGAAGRVRRRDPPQPDRRALGLSPARDPAAERLPARRHDADRAGPARERRRRGGPRAGRRGRRVRAPPARDRARARASAAGSGTIPGSPLRTGARADRERHRARARLARRRVHRLGRGQARLGRLARADRRRPDPHPDRLDRDGAGDQDDLPAARRRGPRRRRSTTSRSRRRTPRIVPDCGPTVASRTAMVVGGMVIKAARRLRAEVEAATGGRFADAYRDVRPGARARSGSTSASSRTRASASTTTTYRGDAYPAFGWAACVARVDVDLDTGEVHVRDVVAADDIGRVIHPGPRRGPGRGRHAPGGRLRDDRGDQAARRPLPQRPARDVHHPDRRSTRRGSRRSSSRRRSAARRTARRGSASCRWTSGRRRSSPRSPMRPAPGSRDLPASPERILAAMAGRARGRAAAAGRVGAGDA